MSALPLHVRTRSV